MKLIFISDKAYKILKDLQTQRNDTQNLSKVILQMNAELMTWLPKDHIYNLWYRKKTK